MIEIIEKIATGTEKIAIPKSNSEILQTRNLSPETTEADTILDRVVVLQHLEEVLLRQWTKLLLLVQHRASSTATDIVINETAVTVTGVLKKMDFLSAKTWGPIIKRNRKKVRRGTRAVMVGNSTALKMTIRVIVQMFREKILVNLERMAIAENIGCRNISQKEV